jgi:transposase
MAHLSAVTKTAIITKALERGKTPLKEIAFANNVGLSTLTRWINSYKQGDVPIEPKLQRVSLDIAPAQKLHHISVCHALKDDALGAYCRQHGFYSHELHQWKSDFLKALAPPDVTKNQEKSDLILWKKKCADLERDVKRKDKALAEASALLIFKKKAHLIWGESEDD